MAEKITEKELIALANARKKDRQAVTRGKRAKRAEGLPEKINSVLETYFRKDGEAILKIDEHRALTNWVQYVGDGAARFSRALRIRNGTLTVVVKDSLWMQQLSLLRQAILNHYRRDFPRLNIRNIYFTRNEL